MPKDEKLVKEGIWWKQRFICLHDSNTKGFFGNQLWLFFWSATLVRQLAYGTYDLKRIRSNGAKTYISNPLQQLPYSSKNLANHSLVLYHKKRLHIQGENGFFARWFFGSFSVTSEKSLWQRVRMEFKRWWTCGRDFHPDKEFWWTFSLSFGSPAVLKVLKDISPRHSKILPWVSTSPLQFILLLLLS